MEYEKNKNNSTFTSRMNSISNSNTSFKNTHIEYIMNTVCIKNNKKEEIKEFENNKRNKNQKIMVNQSNNHSLKNNINKQNINHINVYTKLKKE